MKALIVSSGHFNIELFESVRCKEDMIICADGGARHLYGTDIIPDMIVGDLDSLDDDLVNYYKNLKVKFYKYPSEKDYTDTELAIEYAIDKNIKEITLLGSTGSRLDHTLANIMILYKLLNRGIKAKIIDENNEIFVIDDSDDVQKSENRYLSILPIFGDCRGVSIKGVKYPTNSRNFELGSTTGISNEIIEPMGNIKIDNGVLLVINSKD